jgi:hypothetical protein
MRNLNLGLAALVVGASMLIPGSAVAAPITENLTFSLAGFVDISGTSIPPPITLITGSITVTYDPALSYDNDTTDLVVHYLNGITVGSTLGFTYGNGLLEFGGIANDADFVDFQTNDLVVAFNVTNPNAPTFVPCSTPGYTCGVYTGSALVDAAGYTQANSTTGWFYGVPQSSVSPTLPSSVPEPTTMGLFGFGLTAAAATARRRFRKA